MKKIITITFLLLWAFGVNAQDNIRLPGGETIDRPFTDNLLVILVLYLVTIFILSVIRSIQNYRLKAKMLEKDIPENIVAQFLQPERQDAKTQSIKTFLVLAGIGLGLTLVSYTLPLGIHSLAIMAFSIAVSFLVYYFFIKRSAK